jgi:hypothetical protein
MITAPYILWPYLKHNKKEASRNLRDEIIVAIPVQTRFNGMLKGGCTWVRFTHGCSVFGGQRGFRGYSEVQPTARANYLHCKNRATTDKVHFHPSVASARNNANWVMAQSVSSALSTRLVLQRQYGFVFGRYRHRISTVLLTWLKFSWFTITSTWMSD